jgi:murein DD-endopeptidase MepM/ murein hydrolase activator NlpD
VVPIIACVGLAALSSALHAQTPQLTLSPKNSGPGSIVRVKLDPSVLNRGPVARINGEMAGEPLHFVEGESGLWRAIGGVPVDASDSVVARVVVERVSGGADTLIASLLLPRPRGGTPRRLAVSSRFTQPLDSATEARIARENQRAREIGRASHSTPPMWSASFLKPRASRVTSRFGSGRMFNGRVGSRHLGVDFAGRVGAPVLSANRGVVALVDTFFLAGTVIYIDHGGGLVTGYFHLSKALVATGDTVARGERIGLVGASGRVTGPHLHWSGRYGALAVNPLHLIGLESRWYGRASKAISPSQIR